MSWSGAVLGMLDMSAPIVVYGSRPVFGRPCVGLGNWGSDSPGLDSMLECDIYLHI